MERNKLLRRYQDLFDEPVFDAFLGGSGYANYGYWETDTRDGKEACDNLVDRLVGRLPRTDGTVLDVACGQGGTTNRLRRFFDPRRITAVNLCPRQLARAKERVGDCHLARADAARLPFADASFDAVLCIEAAFHFDTREHFLREARRVLKPGGTLLVADVVARISAGRIPRANLVRSKAHYGEVVERAGFEQVEIEDVSAQTWRTFQRKYSAFVVRRTGVLRLLRTAPKLLWVYPWRWFVTNVAISSYITVVARKPR